MKVYAVTWYNHDEYETGILKITKDYEEAKSILDKETQKFKDEFGFSNSDIIIEETYRNLLGEEDCPLVELFIEQKELEV